MKAQLLGLTFLAAAATTWADSTTLTLPDGGKLSFDAPPLTKAKEVSDATRYQYLATSTGQPDDRFILSVFIEPTDCHFGKSTKEITRCFLEKSDAIPGLVPESRRTECSDKSCLVLYGVAVRKGDDEFRQLHANLIFACRDGWAHVHLSIAKPTDDDIPMLTTFAGSLSYE